MARYSVPGNQRACAQRGFAYLWAMVAIFVLGIYLAKVGSLWSAQAQRAREYELLHRGTAIMMAIKAYTANHRTYPKSLDELVKDPRSPTVRRFLRRAYNDPMTGGDWGMIYRQSDKGLCGVYSTAQGEPFKQNGFPETLRTFAGKTSYSQWLFVDGAVVSDSTDKAPACEG